MSYRAHLTAAAEALAAAQQAAAAPGWQPPAADAATLCYARTALWAGLCAGLRLTTGQPTPAAQGGQVLGQFLAAVHTARGTTGVLDLADQAPGPPADPCTAQLAAAAEQLRIGVDVLASHLGPQAAVRGPAGAALAGRSASQVAAELCAVAELAHHLDWQAHRPLAQLLTTMEPATREQLQPVLADIGRSRLRPIAALAQDAAEVLRRRAGPPLPEVDLAVPASGPVLPVGSLPEAARALDAIHTALAMPPGSITVREATAVLRASLAVAEAGQRLHGATAEKLAGGSADVHRQAAERWAQTATACRAAYQPWLDLRSIHPPTAPTASRALEVARWLTAATRPPATPTMATAGRLTRAGQDWLTGLDDVARRLTGVLDTLAPAVADTRRRRLLLAPNRSIETGRYAGYQWAPLPQTSEPTSSPTPCANSPQRHDGYRWSSPGGVSRSRRRPRSAASLPPGPQTSRRPRDGGPDAR